MDSWNDWYEIAKQYYVQNGNLDVPAEYRDENGNRLGRWIQHQRAKYRGTDSHKCELTEEQINKLNEICIVWDPTELKWNEYYIAASQYYKENGNLMIPAKYVCKNGLKLGQWISKQRSYFLGTSKRGTISNDRIEKLNRIGMVWEVSDYQWEKAYAIAEEYYEANGHLFVEKNYILKGINLGNWIRNQRSKYHHTGDGVLTDDQIKRLEKIEMSWSPQNTKWEKNYLLAKKYYKEHGDLLVPLRYVTESGEYLGAWVGRQRKRKNGTRGGMDSSQEELLNKIGMEWDPIKASFEEKFDEAKQYYIKYGDLEVNNTYITPMGTKHGIWISNLRSDYKHNKLTEETIQRLENIGMLWEVRDSASQTSYAEQIIYFYLKRVFPDAINRYLEQGFEIDVYIPSIKVGVEYDGYAWHKDKKDADNEKNIMCQKNRVELIRLREGECPSLNGISHDIKVGKYTVQNVIKACNKLFELLYKMEYIERIPSISYYEDIREIQKLYKNAKNESWDIMFSEAKKYYEKNGDLRIPYDFVTSDGKKLGSWITNQRSNYAGSSGTGISEKRVKQLESIGMIWNVHDKGWEEGIEEAREYYKKHGNLRVNVKYVSPTGFHLGLWISRQRKNQDSLSKDQFLLLDKLGMIWSVFDKGWEEGIKEAQLYYELMGDLRVPAGYVSDTGFTLGNWIATQRGRYNGNKGQKRLSEEQIKRLDVIGMIWDRAEDEWLRGYNHAKEYYYKHGDLLVPIKYICNDGFALGNWIQTRRGGYKGTGSWACPSEEQKQMLEQIGMVWDVENYTWWKKYAIAKEYFIQNGDLNVPKRFVTEQGEKLGLWIHRQRRMNKVQTGKTLSIERKNALDEIGMVW